MHRKMLFTCALVVLLPGATVGVASANDPHDDRSDETVFLFSEETDAAFVTATGEVFDDDGEEPSTVALAATLSGANEVDASGNPGAGDPEGTGQATVQLNATSGEVCWDITVMGITLPAAAAHIHIGAAGTNGPVVVPLAPPPDATGHSQACTTADPALVAAIAADAAAYYVNVHTTEFPDGAARGQLEVAATPPPGEEEMPQPGDRFFFRDDVFASDAQGTKGALVGSALVQCTFGVVGSLQCQGAVTIDGEGQIHIAATFADASVPGTEPFDIAIVGGTGEFADVGGDATLTETDSEDATVTHWEVHLLRLDDHPGGGNKD
jgi:hypothetical protein